MEELEKRKKENLARTIIPNLKGEEFIKMVGKNEVFVNLFCAANGVGKSFTCCNIVVNICFGVQNKYFDYPLFKKFPYLKKGRIISDPTTLKEKIVPELKKWMPSNRYEVKYETYKEGKSYEARWRTDTGFEFDLMSTEQAPKEFESTDLGWVYIDEPCPKSIYLATIARLRRGGIVFWGMTPLAYSAWIKDNIYDKRDGKNIDYVTADVWDNCKDIEGTRGILSKVDIDRMISQYPEVEYEARVKGKFGHLLGLVHKGYEPKIHKIDPFDISKKDYCVVMALDTHPRVDEHILWMAIDEKGRKFIIDELRVKGTDAELAEAIKERERNWRVVDRLIDPSGFNEDKRTTEVSFAERMMAHGFNFRRGSKLLHECIRRTDVALKYEKKGEDFIREPEVFVFSNCSGLDKELLNYVWDEYKGRTAEERTPKPQPKDINDHFVENLHRLIIEEYTFIPYSPPERGIGESFDPHAVV